MAYPISDVPRRIVYSGSAGVGPYAFTFEVLANTDIAVYKNTTLLTLTTDYTVSINAGTGTGTVTLVVAATGSDSVTLVGDRAIERTSDFVTGGDLFASTLNDELDSLTIAAQQVDEKADRAIRARVTDPTTLDMTLPAYGTRANKLMGFTSGGAPTTTTSTVAQIDAAVSSFVNATGNNASSILYTPAGTGAVATTVQTKLRQMAVSLKDFGAVGDGVTDDTLATQTAVTYCIQNGKALYVPQGTYIINSATGNNQHSGTLAAIRLDFLTANGQGLTMFGEGRGKSIFKEGDGQINAAAPADKKFVRMFLCLMSATSYTLGSFTFMDLTFDKNARSNSLPAAPFDYETSHIIAFSGNAGATTIDAVTVERCEFIDKSAGCFVVGPSTVLATSIVADDIVSVDHPTSVNPSWGQKGCLELACDSQLTVIDKTNCLYSQIEPTFTYDANRYSRFKISNSKIDEFEYTYTGTGVASGNSNIFIDIVNLTSLTSFLTRGTRTKISNSTIKATLEFYDHEFLASNCKILLPYDASTFVVTSLYINRPSAWTVSSTARFSNCDILIDATTVDATTTGYGVRANLNATLPAKVVFDNCYFDPRLYGTCSPYSQGGDFTFNNCVAAGRSGGIAFEAGSFSTYNTKLTLNNNDFSNVAGTYLYIRQATAGYTLKVDGGYPSANWAYGSNNATLVLPAQFTIKPRFYGTAAPASGTWFAGDRVENSVPTVGQPKAWRCTVSGTPGTWVSEGNL